MIEVVISKYTENSEWIQKINHKTIVYDKSNNPIAGSIHRPNIGRESESLLFHIIENYNSLPDLTIFLQGDPRSNPIIYTYDEVIEEINQQHRHELKTILTWEGYVNIRDYWLKSCATLNDILFENCDDMVIYSSGVQYVIPKEVILNRPLKLYQSLHTQLIKYDNKALIANKKNLSDGIDAWTMEVIWGNIFNVNKKLKPGYQLL